MPSKAYLGASSDGKVTCTSVDTCCSGCLEIKCPYSIDKCITVEMTPSEIASEIADKFGDKFFRRWRVAPFSASQLLGSGSGRAGYNEQGMV